MTPDETTKRHWRKLGFTSCFPSSHSPSDLPFGSFLQARRFIGRIHGPSRTSILRPTPLPPLAHHPSHPHLAIRSPGVPCRLRTAFAAVDHSAVWDACMNLRYPATSTPKIVLHGSRSFYRYQTRLRSEPSLDLSVHVTFAENTR